MTAPAREDMEKGNSHSLLVGQQTYTPSTEISVIVPEENWNVSSSRLNYITLSHIYSKDASEKGYYREKGQTLFFYSQ